ncbi:MAG: haloacid dehalogenase-like hydrolase [Duncaniella sp.]|nr:haloacid dehalogenase-like hydrolase [Duncaniella sp.]MDE5962093.1 haloacid dehalogenase-like hydrolase [Duncaniella sp.]MDE6187643.1 haloacid dehalogenase-like hydrolase [Duncaniella sp.]
MVNGHESLTHADRDVPCVIVDLDGTLLQGNSFRMFIRCLVGHLKGRGEYTTLAKVLGLLAARKAGVISHVAMKYPIHRIGSQEMTEKDLAEFASQLVGSLNTRLMSELELLRAEGSRIVLATAAPDLYIPYLFEHLNFDAWIATPLSDSYGSYVEARGEAKRRLVCALAEERGWNVEAVVTDHDDDLPSLLLPFVRRILVNPTATLCGALDSAGLEYETFLG